MIRLTNRLYDPITPEHLTLLANIANEEQDAFFRRNQHTVSFYRDRFLAAALCQGAALHYIGQGQGVKDVDIHFFYKRHPDKPRLSRAVYSIQTVLPAFGVRDIDFVRTLVPEQMVTDAYTDPIAIIRAFLEKQPTANSQYLAEKAVIVLLPERLIGTIAWPM